MEAKEKKTGYLVTFPQHLSSEQIDKLKKALKAAVVSVDPRVEPDDVAVQPKVNHHWALHDRE